MSYQTSLEGRKTPKSAMSSSHSYADIACVSDTSPGIRAGAGNGSFDGRDDTQIEQHKIRKPGDAACPIRLNALFTRKTTHLRMLRPRIFIQNCS